MEKDISFYVEQLGINEWAVFGGFKFLKSTFRYEEDFFKWQKNRRRYGTFTTRKEAEAYAKLLTNSLY